MNDLVRGRNYHWPDPIQGEGSFYCYPNTSRGGDAIVGGDFYDPAVVQFPTHYVGRYFYADYAGFIESIATGDGPGTPERFAVRLEKPTDIEVHPDGSLYYTSRWRKTVRRITYVHTPTPTPAPTATSTPSPTPMAPNTAPHPEIAQPLPGTLYRDGETVAFEGTCRDAEEGVLPPSAMRWDVVPKPHAFDHPGFTFNGVDRGSFVVPVDPTGDPGRWWRIQLTCRDGRGVRRTVPRDIHPGAPALTQVF